MLGFLKSLFGRPKLEMGSAKANALVRREMAAQGDDGSRERRVQHFIYPLRDKNTAPRVEVVDLLSDLGFTVSDAHMQNGLIAEHETGVAEPEFDQLTDMLRRKLAALSYRYDGWECRIFKGSAGS